MDLVKTVQFYRNFHFSPIYNAFVEDFQGSQL